MSEPGAAASDYPAMVDLPRVWYADDDGDLHRGCGNSKVSAKGTEKSKAAMKGNGAEGTRVFSKARGGKNRGNNGNRGVGGSAVPPRLDQYSHGLLL